MSELLPFKDKYKNEKIVLFAPGPTLEYFSYEKYEELREYKKCTVNGGILHKEIIEDLDIFIWAGDIDIPQHPTPSYHYIMRALPKIEKNTLKFVNCWVDNNIKNKGMLWDVQTQIHPENAKRLGFIRYNQVVRNQPSDYYWKDLSSIESGVSIDSVAFQAIQILLYMGFSEIVLVGFDCGGQHSYKKLTEYKNDVCDWGTTDTSNELIGYWRNFKSWLNTNYTSVNISVINPVGLKNIFNIYRK